MWPFKKEPSVEPLVRAIAPNVDEEFGIFTPLLGPRTSGYLPLLNLVEPEATASISLVIQCCASTSNPYPDICGLLRGNDWRPNLVGAVAMATLTHDPEANNELWDAIDRGSWVTPQLAAVAFMRDPMFGDRARERLRSGCLADISRVAPLAAAARHTSTGAGGSVERSEKTAASLVKLAGLLPQKPDWLIAATSSPEMIKLLSKDIDASGLIAEGWLKALKEKLARLGVALAAQA
jgi:hypothetical protein